MRNRLVKLIKARFIRPQGAESGSAERRFRIVALITVRNEEFFLERCIRHLRSQGIDVCIIDNDSTDRTSAIAGSFLGKGVIAVKRYPYPGFVDWRGILKHKETLSYEIDADWFIHQDADEIREAPGKYRNLKEAILEVDRKGFNAINFKEFVFVPTADKESFEGKDYVKGMKYYYFFHPAADHRVNAWKTTKPVNLADSGGHSAAFENRRVFPQDFIMRHYLALNRNHLIAKTFGKAWAPEELRDGWHIKRKMLNPDSIRFPDKSELNLYRDDGLWETSKPWKKHFFDLT